MGIYDNEVMKTVARRSMTIFFIVDTSGSMAGNRIGVLNQAIEDAIPEIQAISASNADAVIKVAVLEFSNCAQWITPEPVEIKDFSWTRLDCGGMTALGDACHKLEQKLHKEAFMNDPAGCFAPVFILLSDGEPNDDYEPALEKLKQNNWFKKGIRAAIAIDAELAVLEEFTGNIETVLTAYTPEQLRRFIRFVSVTASQVASTSSSISSKGADAVESKQDVFINALQKDNMMQGPVDDGSDLGDLEW